MADEVLIAGGGIAGLTLGLTLHQIGVPFRIYEAAREMKPLGVGINIQPNAVRELIDLGCQDILEEVGIRTRDYGFFTKRGLEIWSEPRGTWAGYAWPQYSVHRGQLQMRLFERLIERAGPRSVVLGHKAIRAETRGEGAALSLLQRKTNAVVTVPGALIVAADGIRSSIRAQFYPDEGEPIWDGRVLWRATSQAPAFRGGAAMALIGHDTQRIVAYPLTHPDPDTGLVTMNWLAELTFDPTKGWASEDWNREAKVSDFDHAFRDWTFDWLDVPGLIASAERVFEYPMVDRDPIDQWTFGRVTFMGDAAHPTYPVGSSGASQAIVDARVLGAEIRKNGLNAEALLNYEDRVRPVANGVVRANRGSGPDAVMQMVEDRCGGQFDDIEDVVPRAELSAHAEKYKALAGFSIEELNARPAIIGAL